MKTSIYLPVLLLLIVLSGCQKGTTDTELIKNTFTARVSFKNVVDALPLQFNQPYVNIHNETYSVQVFKFYICQLDLINTQSNVVYHLNKNEYYLLDAADINTLTIVGKANAERYDRIAFTMGVDSLRNVSGAQTGTLDPAKGMFWTWNSGYIMAKMEGSSPLSNQPGNKIEYHIGGFKGPENVLKRIILPFPQGGTVDFLPGGTSTITIAADVNKWFGSTNNINIANNPVCTTPGTLATKIAENYSNMFTISGIVNY